MPRSAPGAETGLLATSTRPVVGGNCGRRPAMRRRIVDFPHPEGPRIVMNSPLPGKSSTRNVTFLIAVKPSSYVLETPLNSTIGGRVGKRGRGSASAATLAGAEQIAEPVLRVDQLRQHDVSERKAEQGAQIVVDVRQGRGDQHFRDDLAGVRTQS